MTEAIEIVVASIFGLQGYSKSRNIYLLFKRKDFKTSTFKFPNANVTICPDQ